VEWFSRLLSGLARLSEFVREVRRGTMPPARARQPNDRANFVNAGSFSLGDALERYGESHRPAVSGAPRTEHHATTVSINTIGRARWPQRVQGARWLGKPARDAIPHLGGGAPDDARAREPEAALKPDRLRQNRSYQSQVPGSAGRCASAGWADSSAVACSGTPWPAPEFEQFSVDALPIRGRPPHQRPREPNSPEQPQALTAPTQNSRRLDDHQTALPTRPPSRQSPSWSSFIVSSRELPWR